MPCCLSILGRGIKRCFSKLGRRRRLARQRRERIPQWAQNVATARDQPAQANHEIAHQCRVQRVWNQHQQNTIRHDLATCPRQRAEFAAQNRIAQQNAILQAEAARAAREQHESERRAAREQERALFTRQVGHLPRYEAAAAKREADARKKIQRQAERDNRRRTEEQKELFAIEQRKARAKAGRRRQEAERAAREEARRREREIELQEREMLRQERQARRQHAHQWRASTNQQLVQRHQARQAQREAGVVPRRAMPRNAPGTVIGAWVD